VTEREAIKVARIKFWTKLFGRTRFNFVQAARIAGVSKAHVYRRIRTLNIKLPPLAERLGTRLIFAEINRERRPLKHWASVAGIPFTTMLARYNRGERGQTLLRPSDKNKAHPQARRRRLSGAEIGNSLR
jgi:hypothetical protein